MSHIQRVGFVSKSYPELVSWCRTKIQESGRSSFSTYAPGRSEIWFKTEASLRNEVSFRPGQRDARLEALGDRLFSGWHTAALFSYSPGTCIKPHRDHKVFGSVAVMVNIGEADFEIAGQLYRLAPGEVLRFSTKVLHGSRPSNKERFSIVFWKFKPEYLNHFSHLL